jgi:hypothetical protein
MLAEELIEIIIFFCIADSANSQALTSALELRRRLCQTGGSPFEGHP